MDQQVDGYDSPRSLLDQARDAARQYEAHYHVAQIEDIETYLALVMVSEELTRGYERFVGSPGESLSRTRVGVLRLLYFSEDRRLPLSELARMMNFTSTNATRLIDGLAREGWVERVASSTDRRVTYAQLTSEGLARCEKLFPVIVRYMAAITSALSAEEQSSFKELLGKVGATARAIEPLEAESPAVPR